MRAHYIIYSWLLGMAMLFASCTPSSEHTVCFFGSSVCQGVGADSLQGYADCVSRFLPSGWQTINISVGGNNTYDLLARYNSDLLPTQAKYVVLGLSLGNEGLHEKGERALLSYRENMPRLIDSLQCDGRTVIVTNNYPRADFNSVDYADLCVVNLEVQQWEVTTINLFGTIDDGAGHWAEGYWNGTDIYHPNNRGHKALASSFPPSLFAALDAGKPLPQYVPTDGIKSGVGAIGFTADPGLESYTLAYTNNDTAYAIVYSDCRRCLQRYINGNCVATIENYTDTTTCFSIVGQDICQLFFFRAAMTDMEVSALAQGKMLRSSLELYCPLLGGNTDNLAQTLNNIQLIDNQSINN